MLVKGTDLTTVQKTEVLASYIYRHITDYYDNDDETWLAEHAFYVKTNGSLDKRYNHCVPYYLAD